MGQRIGREPIAAFFSANLPVCHAQRWEREVMLGSVRFAFGENWRDYAVLLDVERIEKAKESLRALLSADLLDGCRFLDIGCGSGLFSLAALNLGAREVVSVDLDPNSVAAAESVLRRFAPGKSWRCAQDDVFAMTPEKYGRFDVVYSWGVLHHTGDMFRAIERALSFVRPGGHLLIALYGKTPFCGFWAWEKRSYVTHRPWFPVIARSVYKPLILLRLLLAGRNPIRYIEAYCTQRGMNWRHDAEDWLGGYPYESVAPQVAVDFVEARGFTCCASKTEKRIGLFGSGCDEYLFRRHDGGEKA